MKYREAGSTGLQVSEIGFGCGGTAGLMLKGSPSERQRVIARALELGINYFDNAPDYGDGLAEENLGSDLRALGAKPVIVTKVEVRHADLADIAGHVQRSAEASLKRLGVEAIDILQIHNGPTRNPPDLQGRAYSQLGLQDFLRAGGALEGLQRVLRDGKARFIGFICRGNDGGEVRQLLQTGLFNMINVPYTLLNPTAGMDAPPGLEVAKDFGNVITAAREHGVGVAVYSPMAGGFLTDHFVSGGARHPHSRGLMDPASTEFHRQLSMAREFSFLSVPGKHSLAQAAMRFPLMHSGVTVVLGGYSDIKQLEEGVPASCEGPLSDEMMHRVEAVWRGNFGQH